MEHTKRFEVTDQHLKLLARMYVGWDDCEFGAPAIDCKRPYGNSDVLGDMAEILPDVAKPDLHRLHREMATVLQIGISTGTFVAGVYEAHEYRVDWRLVP